jgi:hypothetical protein
MHPLAAMQATAPVAGVNDTPNPIDPSWVRDNVYSDEVMAANTPQDEIDKQARREAIARLGNTNKR